jgi:hypothetical protein
LHQLSEKLNSAFNKIHIPQELNLNDQNYLSFNQSSEDYQINSVNLFDLKQNLVDSPNLSTNSQMFELQVDNIISISPTQNIDADFNIVPPPDNLSIGDFDQVNNGLNIEYHPKEMFNSTVTAKYCDGAITPDDNKAVYIYDTGAIFWLRGGMIGTVKGNYYYNNSSNCIARLGSNLKIYNAHDEYIGYAKPNGNVYTPDGQLYVTGGTLRWGVATFVYNTCNPS